MSDEFTSHLCGCDGTLRIRWKQTHDARRPTIAIQPQVRGLHGTPHHLSVKHYCPLVARAVDAVCKVRSLVHEPEVLVDARVGVDPSSGGDSGTTTEERRRDGARGGRGCSFWFWTHLHQRYDRIAFQESGKRHNTPVVQARPPRPARTHQNNTPNAKLCRPASSSCVFKRR